MKRHSWWVAFLLLLLGASASLAQVQLKEVVAFGDSLTDNDLLGLNYGNPQDMYGRDPIEAVYRKGAVHGDHLSKYALAGTTSDDLEIQIGIYESFLFLDLQAKATLFNLESGSNDVLNNIDLLAAHPPGENARADEVTTTIIDNLRSATRRLRESHPNAQFVIWTLPDVTLSPDLWSELTRKEARNVRAHLQRVNRFIRRLNQRPFVSVFDLYATLRQFIVEPPVIMGQALVLPPDFGDYDHLFADQLHPTAVSNALLANRIIRGINNKWNDHITMYGQRSLARLAHITP